MSSRASPPAIPRLDAHQRKTGLLDARFRGFSCPQEGLDEAFLGLVTATYARETMRVFLDRYAAALTDGGSGLVDLLNAWLRSETAFDAFWDPAIGQALSGIQTGDAAAALSPAAILGLRANALGCPGAWSLALPKPMRLQWDRWLLPTADRIAVACDDQAARIRTGLRDAERETLFTRTAEGWHCANAEALSQFGTHDRRINVLSADALTSGGADTLDDSLPVAEHAPPELLRVLRSVIPLQQVGDVRSGSVGDRFGIIYLSLGLNAVTMAESLVHEASHQYLNVLCRLGPVDDGTDTRLYYSPAMRTDRPLGRILVAYHAFANMLLFYRLCGAHRMPDDGYRAREAELVSQVEQLERPLRTNDALTDIGRGLRDPLMERLH